MADADVSSIAEAVEFLKLGDLVKAARAANAVGESNPDALHLLGLVRCEQNLHSEALDFFNRSLAERPGHPHVLTNLGKTLKFLGRNAEAVSAFNAALAGQPDLADALCELGELQYRAGDYAEAESLLQRVLVQMPNHAQAQLWLGLVFKDSGRLAEAEALLGAGLIQARETSLKATFVYYLASAQHQQGKKERALDNFALASRLNPQFNADADLKRAEILEEMQRSDEAVALLERILAREPGNVAVHGAYNNLLYRLGRDETFLTSYDRAPKSPALLASKADLLLKRGRPAEAQSLYSEVLKSEPDNVQAAVGVAAALSGLNRNAEAVALLEQTLRHQPESSELYHTLACTALQLRDPQKAAAMAEQSLRIAPTDQAGLALLGTAWRMMGDARDETLNGYNELIRVFDLEPPQGYSSMEDFNIELNAWLSGLHTDAREPLQQSLRGGSQTPGYIFGRGHTLAERLKVRIEEAITSYLAAMKPDAKHPFRGRRGRGFRFRDSWSSRLRDGGFHANHIHRGGWISSCYYVALPEAVKDESGKQGWIKFGEPGFEVGLSLRRAVQPKVGRLVLFPSYMWHGTVPFREKAARTTIAFDVIPN
ncbi:MAG TPA: tetratricopeptide repeat protein [Rhizomicrobium sp.]|nr:tetratricopeptide repeat protein [Rhizomicrobium sp.]